MYHALITVHAGDIHVDDHTTPLATVHDSPLELDSSTVDLGGTPDGQATAATWQPANGRPPVPTFVGAWTDADGVRHASQLPIAFADGTVFDFGPYRAVVTES